MGRENWPGLVALTNAFPVELDPATTPPAKSLMLGGPDGSAGAVEASVTITDPDSAVLPPLFRRLPNQV